MNYFYIKRLKSHLYHNVQDNQHTMILLSILQLNLTFILQNIFFQQNQTNQIPRTQSQFSLVIYSIHLTYIFSLSVTFMLSNFKIYVLTLILFIINQLANSQIVQNQLDYFRTQYCPLYVLTSGTRTYSCLTRQPQSNIIRQALSLVEYTKAEKDSLKFITQIQRADSTTKFQITITFYNQIATNIKFGYFLILIKSQHKTQFIDLVHLNFGSKRTNGYQSQLTQTINMKNISLQTIFNRNKKDLVYIPFLTSVYFQEISDEAMNKQNNSINIQIINYQRTQFQCFQITSFNLKRLAQLKNVRAFSLVLDNSLFSTNKSQIQFNYLLKSFKIKDTHIYQHIYQGSMPQVNKQCFMGIVSIDVNLNQQFTLFLHKYSLQQFDFQIYYNGPQGNQFHNIFFCFYSASKNSMVLKTQNIYQSLNLKQQINLNSLQNNLTQNYYKSQLTSQFNNDVKINIKKRSLSDANCGYGLHRDYIGPTPYCRSCGYKLCPDCNITTCLQCFTPSEYINPATGSCDPIVCPAGKYVNIAISGCTLCSIPIVNCATCSDNVTCITCISNYTPHISPSGNTICQLCVILIFQCKPLKCITQFYCDECQPGFYVNLINTTYQDCLYCNMSLGNTCLQCSDNITCTLCQYSYFLQSNTTTANVTTVTCTLCASVIYNCLECNDNITCILCIPGYILKFDPMINLTVCQACHTLYYNCHTCNTTDCTSYFQPYTFDNAGLCNNCSLGSTLIQGYCFNQAGCLSSTVINGNNVCISCAPFLNFIYNTTNKNCSCAIGFKPFYRVNVLMQCIAICGDGLLLSNYQECDDGNLAVGDGCDNLCKQQYSFQCSNTSPSLCVLHFNFYFLQYNYVQRVIGQHKGILSYLIHPPHPGLVQMKWSKLLKLNFSSAAVQNTSLKYTYDPTIGELKIQFTYLQQMQDVYLSANLTFDPTLVVSIPSSLYQECKLNGLNAPLLFQSDKFMQMQKNIDLMAYIFVILVLVQFYLGSYFHKMIGLQTIQIVQMIYFLRMLGSSSSKNILNSLNSVKYSASGYQNWKMFFQIPSNTTLQQHTAMKSEFLGIGLENYFVMNVNLSLFPLIIIYLVYIISLIRKYCQRKSFILKIDSKEQRQIFTPIKRAAQWIYNHFVFPYSMMFNAIVLFNFLAFLQSAHNGPNTDQTQIYAYSFAVHTILVLISFGIQCYQIINSYQQFLKSQLTSKQRNLLPASLIQKAQTDKNSPYRQNYHPFYVFVYLLTYSIYWGVIAVGIFFEGFDYGLQTLLGLNALYLLIIYKWRPYHQQTKFHNYFLCFNQITLIIFLLNCIVFTKLAGDNNQYYLLSMYIMLALLIFVNIGGFVRIFLQRRYRNLLQANDGLVIHLDSQASEREENGQNADLNDAAKNKINKFNNKSLSLQRKGRLLIDNNYVFQNQLKKMRDQIQHGFLHNQSQQNNFIQHTDLLNNEMLISKIREQYTKKRNQMLFNKSKDRYKQNVQHLIDKELRK